MAATPKRAIWWPILVTAVFLVCALAVFKGTQKLYQIQARLDEIQQTNRTLTERNKVLYQTVIRLRNNEHALEKACRQEMGMIRPDEVIYQYPKGKNSIKVKSLKPHKTGKE